ncbi:MAG: MBOAT family protein [Alphaproteobacteria bacterium]|nr:MBOAT family protein [Alphaproteobacteria bacterium]MBU1516307.1 MBOAT family protein [Alphaproteobacteria bacterium]MBU2093147.1 MBOAT family protein [Alphaproteobacteria bacterium]MBU2150407.1 MBOAT family protein [Alphaproteobacteria bacterium]MBU2308783.1 MBOAT family protein [Alphaproteobacteria bacterium]
MVFSSIIFIFYFLPIFLLGYYLSGWRPAVLLAGSVAFYVWGEGPYIFLLAALIAANYAGSRVLAGAESQGRRRAILTGLIVLDLGVLGVFKYAGFLAHNLNALGLHLPELKLALPLGISFFTFQLISYVADVYWRRVAVEPSLTRFAAYILMFPHLIAGPIVRFANIAEELHADRRKSGRIGLGFQYFIVGLCQKVLVANSVAPLADHAFGLGGALDQATAWLGALAYALQIYFDFCGYSNMAIGLAFMLGFTFPKNFDHPYASRSITEFWRRWHISLSSWFRDYVYIPLGGNRAGSAKTVRNLLVVFLLTGVWHGAAWTFVVWGLYHGAFLLIERFGLARLLALAPRFVGHAYALLVVLVGWVLFRADTLPHALDYLAVMANPATAAAPPISTRILLNAQTLAALAAGMVFAVPTLPWLLERLRTPRLAPAHTLEARLDTQGVHVLATAALILGLLLSIALLAGTTLNPFLYFRF